MNRESTNFCLHDPRSTIHDPRSTRSYAWCERLARQQAGNFYHAFRLLPADQRRAMCALYAFLRVADDVTDGPEAVAEKRLALAEWRQQLDEALAGVYHHPLHPAFHHTVQQYHIPRRYLDDVLDGVGMDLDTDHYDTFADLYRYCYRVASAVGLACIHIWGFAEKRATDYAEAAGIALQLTNILRDVGEDAARGRVYLPARGPRTLWLSGRGPAARRARRALPCSDALPGGPCGGVTTSRRRRWPNCSIRPVGRCSWSCCEPIADCWRRLCGASTTCSAAGCD